MKAALSKIGQLAIFILGMVLCIACSWLLVRFFAYGDNHPVNVALGVFGLAPVMPNVGGMGWNDDLVKLVISCATAVMSYLILASLVIAATQKALAVISAGGFKKYPSMAVAQIEANSDQGEHPGAHS